VNSFAVLKSLVASFLLYRIRHMVRLLVRPSFLLALAGRKVCRMAVIAFVVITLSLCIMYSAHRASHRASSHTLTKTIRSTDFVLTSEQRQSIGKVFIASNLRNSVDLIRGPWGQAVKDLVSILSADSVFLSVFEDNSVDGTDIALHELADELECKSSVITSVHTPLFLNDTPTEGWVTLRSGQRVMRRVPYLASLRNKVLEPLTPEYDRILFINDVAFSAKDALTLLLTENGKYSTACGFDFINPFKFYDTWATRDSSGQVLGIPIYPFFGPGKSRDQLASGQVVSVRSCWSGIVAFNAGPFHDGLKFRAADLGWEASECCLINADIDSNKTFMNPAVRVAYDEFTYRTLKWTKMVEKVLSVPQRFITWAVDRLKCLNRRETVITPLMCMSRMLLVIDKNGFRRAEDEI
jgi:hypothetical protein